MYCFERQKGEEGFECCLEQQTGGKEQVSGVPADIY